MTEFNEKKNIITMADKDNTAIAGASANDEIMEVVVTTRFLDKDDLKTWYEVGAEMVFERERAENLIERGLAEAKIIMG